MSSVVKKALIISLAIPGGALVLTDILSFTFCLGQKLGTYIRMGG